MLQFIRKIPNHVIVVLQRLGIAFLLFLLTRIVFLIHNSISFPNLGFSEFMIGSWFDLITVALYYLPIYGIFLLPLPIRGYRWHQFIMRTAFMLMSGFVVLVNLVDVAYYRFTYKRSTFDLFDTISVGDDFAQLLGTYLSDFWWLTLYLILILFLAFKLYRKTEKRMLHTLPDRPSNFYWSNAIYLTVITGIFFLIGRGGIRPKPIGILDASNYSTPENTAFVLNTPFTMLKTIAIRGVESKIFFSEEEANQLFSPIHKTAPQQLLPDSTNVVVVILESFGMEFVGAVNGKSSYTPFFDSIMHESLRFRYTFANGRKSVEALPAIVASMPSLMNESYIASPYGDNSINSLPNILKREGYSSAFYHGATNGSMRFDAFSSICGFDQYVGRKEYGNDAHFDGTWGIMDEYFCPWAAEQMSDLPPPFCSVLFTVSSHHPYYIPPHMKDKVKSCDQPIGEAISYADYCLSKFFETAKKQPWFENTLFVFVADHGPSSLTPLYNERSHLYRIPLAFYHPLGNIKPLERFDVAQQLDVFPTVLDLLNIDTEYYSFGSSLVQETAREAIVYTPEGYQYFNDEYMITFYEEKAQKLINFTKDEYVSLDSSAYYSDFLNDSEQRIKAIIQQYANDLIKNKTTAGYERAGYEKNSEVYH